MCALQFKRGFHPTRRTQGTERKERKERNEITSVFDRPITAASDDGVCRWHAAELWQTRAKLLKLNFSCIVSCTTSKNVLKFGLLIPKKGKEKKEKNKKQQKRKLNLKNLSSAGKRTARFLLAGACVSYVSCVHCVALYIVPLYR